MSKVLNVCMLDSKVKILCKEGIASLLQMQEFHAVSESTPLAGNLSSERTKGTTPFKIVGVDRHRKMNESLASLYAPVP